MNMHQLAEEKAIQLCKMSLRKYMNATPGERKEMIPKIKQLCYCLEYHPLAIQLAISYLNGMLGAVSIDNFIEEYEKKVIAFEQKGAEVGDQYSHTLATVFDLSMDLIAKTDCALEMIYFLSFCTAEGTLIEFFELLYGKTVTCKAVAALVRFNLASTGTQVRVSRLAAQNDDEPAERESALHHLAEKLATLDDDDEERKFTLHQIAQKLKSSENEGDENRKPIISVKREVQKVVSERVLEKVELIEVVFQAAFIVESGDNFPIMETLMGSKQQVDNEGCDLYFIFLHHWDLVHTDEVAASAVMMTVFCRLDKGFPWAIFGKRKVGERTFCSRADLFS